MNGKDIFLGLGYIDSKFIEEAEKEELHPVIHSWKRSLLIAALVAIMLMLVGCSVAYAQGWFTSYFAQSSDKPLSSGQVEYIERNEQVIGESQVQNEWTVELRSALSDGTTGYIIVGITAPEGVDLEPEIVDGSMVEKFGAGNSGMFLINTAQDMQPILTASDGRKVGTSGSWREDGDGKDNTKNIVFRLEPDPNEEYHIHIENIVRQYEDREYLEELLRTKYAGQTDYMLDHQETQRLLQYEVLTEGVWDFTVRLDREAERVELLTEPVKVMGYATRRGERLFENFYDSYKSYEEIEVTSILLSPLSVTIRYNSDVNCNFAIGAERETYVVMKDGSRVETFESGRGSEPHNLILDPQAPIVLDEVDHILLPDGTKISMP